MKKIIILISIALVMISVVLSCKKNQSDSVSLNAPSGQVISANQSIEQQILSFKLNIERPLKDGNDYLIDTAVWYTEALINYTYATIDNDHEGQSLDSVFIDISLSDGKVTSAEAASVYNKIIDSLTVQYENLPSQNLHLICVDVFSRDSTAGNVTFGIISSFGYGPTISLGEFNKYVDYWTFGWGQYDNGGYCDGENQGYDTDSDAAMQIERRIRHMIPVYTPRRYPTNVVHLLIHCYGDIKDLDENIWYYCDITNADDETWGDNYYEYYMFYNYHGWPNFHFCLTPDEMNFHLYGTYSVFTDIIYDCLGEILTGKELTTVKMVGDNTSDWPDYYYLHVSTNSYGNWNVTTEPPANFD
jgi:hypothetical protein